MKVILPDGQQIKLDETISLEEKKIIARQITDDYMLIIIANWNSNAIRYFLDSMSNYLVWHKDKEEIEKKVEDKYVLSKKKTEKLVRYKKTSKEIMFSDLDESDKEKLFGS